MHETELAGLDKQQIEIFQSKDGQTQVEVRFDQDTLWLSQAQMAELFEKATFEESSVVHWR